MIQKEIEQKVGELTQLIESFQSESKTRALGEKQPTVSFIASLLLPIAFNAVMLAAEQINDDLAKDFTVFGIKKTQDIVSLLTDSDKNNLKQIQKHFGENWRVDAGVMLDLILRMFQKYNSKNHSVINLVTTLIERLKTA